MPGRVRIELRLLDETLRIDAPLPPQPARLDELLPLMYAIDDAAIARTVEHHQGGGRTVSCRKGCSACCRAQPVPVTPPEAYALARLVEALPQESQREVRARFSDRVERLREAGLDRPFLARDPSLDAAKARELARRYFALGLVCPFLEDDACSIHHRRPFVCRQYLVTSPASLCVNPFDNAVDVVPAPLNATRSMLATAAGVLGRPQYTVPLVLALEYAQQHHDELARSFDGEEPTHRWLQGL